MRLFISCLAIALATAACDGGSQAARDTEKAANPQAAAAEVPVGEADYSHAGEPAPDLTLLREDEGPMTLTAFRGTPTLVNLWATWCAPCVAELPSLDRLAAREGYDLNVLAVSQDMQGWDKIRPFLQRVPLDQVTVLADPSGTLAGAYGAAGLPLTVMYDAEGRELWRVSGPREWDEPGGMPAETAAAATAGAAAGRNGPAYVARGQEPGWIVRIVPGERLDVEVRYGEAAASFPAPSRPLEAPFTLDLESETHSFTMEAAAAPCADVMSGAEYPHTVTIALNGETYRGCGGPA